MKWLPVLMWAPAPAEEAPAAAAAAAGLPSELVLMLLAELPVRVMEEPPSLSKKSASTPEGCMLLWVLLKAHGKYSPTILRPSVAPLLVTGSNE
jgi:hypothetical protein